MFPAFSFLFFPASHLLKTEGGHTGQGPRAPSQGCAVRCRQDACRMGKREFHLAEDGNAGWLGWVPGYTVQCSCGSPELFPQCPLFPPAAPPSFAPLKGFHICPETEPASAPAYRYRYLARLLLGPIPNTPRWPIAHRATLPSCDSVATTCCTDVWAASRLLRGGLGLSVTGVLRPHQTASKGKGAFPPALDGGNVKSTESRLACPFRMSLLRAC
ncbi:hypothetical protein QBC39DRAFT_96261 [Podospora conica]|nr:hypothetical protein QBC39DRAFT_96261 [Schizothecium conicum]